LFKNAVFKENVILNIQKLPFCPYTAFVLEKFDRDEYTNVRGKQPFAPTGK